MSGNTAVGFSPSINQQTFKSTNGKKEVVYVSKTPQVAVNATGVVAGTGGMIGGAVLGGLVGIFKLPGECVKQLAGQNYSKIIQDAFNGFKETISKIPEFSSLKNAIKESKSPAAAEEILEIAKTLSGRLHRAFAEDPHASSVINKVVDPVISGISLKNNVRNYGSAYRSQVKSSITQTILKLIGFNKKTSTIIGGVTGNFAEGIAIAVENVKNFTPEEKEAWKKVLAKMSEEFEHNPKIKVSKNVTKAVKEMFKNKELLIEPIKKLQKTIIDTAKGANNSLGKVPVKTIGLHSAIGAAVCGTISLLGWFSMKKGLMAKETQKAQMNSET